MSASQQGWQDQQKQSRAKLQQKWMRGVRLCALWSRVSHLRRCKFCPLFACLIVSRFLCQQIFADMFKAGSAIVWAGREASSSSTA